MCKRELTKLADQVSVCTVKCAFDKTLRELQLRIETQDLDEYARNVLQIGGQTLMRCFPPKGAMVREAEDMLRKIEPTWRNPTNKVN